MTAQAQYSVYNEVWLEAGAQYKKKDYSFGVTEGFRMHEGMAGQTFTQLDGDYSIKKWVSIGVSYRWIQKPTLFNIEEFDHRFTVDASFTYKMGDIDLGFRPRFQHRLKGISADDGKRSKTYNRNKFSLEYSGIKKVSIELNYEFFLRVGVIRQIDQNRYSLELKYKLNKENRVSAFYMLQQEVNVVWPELTHVVGLTYSYRF